MRTYRPVPETVSVWMPPVPVVVEKIGVQFTASGDVWIWNALPYAVSQFRVTWQIDWVEPRSTCSHCGSLKALDQRVPRLPSTAAEAGGPAFSVEDAVAGWLRARLVVPQVAAEAAGTMPGLPRAVVARNAATRASAATATPMTRERERCRTSVYGMRLMDVLSRMRGPHRRGVGAGRTYSYETVQMNVIAATAPAADFPVTVTVLVPGDRPVPRIRPDGVMVRPAGSPVAL